jgi:putative tricarboxylic transport membrane protein
MRTRAVVISVAGVGVAAWLWLISSGFKDVARAGQLGPRFWPRVVLVGLGLTCAVHAVMAWRRGATPAAAPGATAAGGQATRATPSPGALALAIAALLFYVLAAPVLGFPLTTAVFIAAFMRLAGARSPLAIGATAALGAPGLVYLFVKVVYLPLPKGTGLFEDLTIALYRALRIF